MDELQKILTDIEKETTANISQVKEEAQTIPEGKKETLVSYLQDVCNVLYNQYGFCDSILELQVYINQLRHEYNITDPSEVVNREDGKEFVQ